MSRSKNCTTEVKRRKEILKREWKFYREQYWGSLDPINDLEIHSCYNVIYMEMENEKKERERRPSKEVREDLEKARAENMVFYSVKDISTDTIPISLQSVQLRRVIRQGRWLVKRHVRSQKH